MSKPNPLYLLARKLGVPVVLTEVWERSLKLWDERVRLRTEGNNLCNIASLTPGTEGKILFEKGYKLCEKGLMLLNEGSKLYRELE